LIRSYTSNKRHLPHRVPIEHQLGHRGHRQPHVPISDPAGLVVARKCSDVLVGGPAGERTSPEFSLPFGEHDGRRQPPRGQPLEQRGDLRRADPAAQPATALPQQALQQTAQKRLSQTKPGQLAKLPPRLQGQAVRQQEQNRRHVHFVLGQHVRRHLPRGPRQGQQAPHGER